jgi:CubicO group peptidase (beta-lactamase class C family)
MSVPILSKPVETVFPGKTWETREPREAGLDEAPLGQIARLLGGRGCIVKDGRVAAQWGPQSVASDWLSSAKPVFSTLLLFAVAEGKIQGPEAPIAGFGWPLQPKDRTMTFVHLANMVSGYARPEAPGAAWAYNDFAINLYQITLFDYLFREGPEAAAMHPRRLGFLELEDGLRFRPGNRRLLASVRDFARIAWCWLHRGRWKDTQLLPLQLFNRYHRPQVPPALPHTANTATQDYLGVRSFGGGSDHFTKFGPGIYGFNWWFNGTSRLHPDRVTWPDAPRDTFMTIGAGGNCSAVIPSLGIVLAAAGANWGDLAPGNRDAPQNRCMKLLVDAARRP